MNDQAIIAGLALLIFLCLVLGYLVGRAERKSERAGADEPTEHGRIPL